MAISTQYQNLNLIPGKSAPVVVHCSQGNVGDTVGFYLYDGDEPFYPTNVSIAVHGVRADGSVFGPYTVAVTSGSNLVTFELVTAMTSVAGAAIGELVITDSGENQVGTANFGLLVETTPYSSTVTYEDDLSIYQRILAYVQSIPASLQSQITGLSNTETLHYRYARKATSFAGLDELRRSRYVVIGDSYAGGYTPETGSVEANGWPGRLKAALSVVSNDFIVSHAGGTGFANPGGGTTWGDTINTIAVTSPETINYVIFCGGYNDASKTDTEIQNGMVSAINNAHSRFPNAKVFVGWIGMSFADIASYLAIRRAYKNYVKFEKQLDYIYLKGIQYVLHKESQFSATDKYHPNELGNQDVADAILRCLITGSDSMLYEKSVSLKFKSGTSADSAVSAYELKDGHMTIYTNGTTLRFTGGSAVTLNQYKLPLFASDVSAFLKTENDDSKAFSAMVNFTESGTSKYKALNGLLTRGDDGYLCWKITDANDGNNNFRTVTINNIQLPPLKITVDLLGQGFY